MTAETLAGTSMSLKDILPVPADTLSRRFRKTIPFVDEQKLRPEDAVKVAITTVWEENPNQAEKDIATFRIAKTS